MEENANFLAAKGKVWYGTMGGWDGRIRSATIQLPIAKQIERPMNMLYPMEIDASEDIEDKVEDKSEEPIARRTRSAKRLQMSTLLLITLMSLISKQATNQLILMENSPNETFDPENVKFQYLFDSLRQELLQQLKETYQSSCQNKNNLLLLIKWLSISNPTLAAKLMLQRNDVIAKRIDGNLMVALCKSERLAIENIEFKGGKDEFFWQEISEGEKFVEQMEKEYNEIVLPIKEEFEDNKLTIISLVNSYIYKNTAVINKIIVPFLQIQFSCLHLLNLFLLLCLLILPIKICPSLSDNDLVALCINIKFLKEKNLTNCGIPSCQSLLPRICSGVFKCKNESLGKKEQIW
uniref:Uncharacterized protein n=1 Tax=Wuchereria bancrofti TaxID=6293 RepID=A0AAF5Q5F3_WUCBA